jgi:hypothetical protein
VNKLLIILILAITSFGVMASASRTVDADSITSSDKTKTYSLPAATDTLTGRASTDTFSNKTISGANNTFNQLPIATQFIRDAFSGTGTQTAFTLSQTPFNTGHVQVFQDGILMIITTDYTISGTTLTMVTAPALGQTLAVIYSRY